MPQSVTERFATWITGLRFEQLPADVVATLKALLLDTLGTALAAGTLGDGCRELRAVAQHAGGAAESSVIGFGERLPAATAALVNGGLAHALNYDAVGAAHFGIIPVAPLALAERRGEVTGRDLLTALAAGCEVSGRLGAAIGGGHPTALLGQMLSYFGAAAASARMLGLTPEQTQSALGLALMQTAGARQIVIEGDPPAKAIYGAFPSHAGVLSALLAAEGLGAVCDALAGNAGLPALVARPGGSRMEIDDNFGTRFYLLSANFKPWPVSGHVTPFIEAALDLVQSERLQPDEIARVRLAGDPSVRAWFEPAAKRKRPDTSPAAANSIYFAVAKAVVNGRVTLADFSQDGLNDEATLAFTNRMEHVLDSSLESGTVEIFTSSGRRFSRRVGSALGSPSRPLSADQLESKFRDCARHAIWRIPEDALSRVIESVERLQELPNVAVIPRLLRPPE